MRMRSRTLICASVLLGVLLLFWGPAQVALAQTFQATYGSPVDMSKYTLNEVDPNSTYFQPGQYYQMIQTYSAAGLQGGLKIAGYQLLQGAQDVVNKVLQDTEAKIQSEEAIPVYIFAQSKDMSCNVLNWCTYTVQVTAQFQAPPNQQQLVDVLIIVIVIAVILILAYLVYQATQSVGQFLASIPGTIAAFFTTYWPVIVIIGIVVVAAIYIKKRK